MIWQGCWFEKRQRIVFALCIALLILNWCSFLWAIIYYRLLTWCLLQLVVFTRRAGICPGRPWCCWWRRSSSRQRGGECSVRTHPALLCGPCPPGDLPPDPGHCTIQRIQIRDISTVKRFITWLCFSAGVIFSLEIMIYNYISVL